MMAHCAAAARIRPMQHAAAAMALPPQAGRRPMHAPAAAQTSCRVPTPAATACSRCGASTLERRAA